MAEAAASDPFTFAVIKSALDTIVDDMAYTVMRTARSRQDGSSIVTSSLPSTSVRSADEPRDSSASTTTRAAASPARWSRRPKR